MITELPIVNRIQTDNKTHTASDGSKIVNKQVSFHANYSYKFGGSATASSQYSHIDNRSIVFYSTIISASDQEAPHVIDGLLHSKWVQSDMHSTDTFGITEAVSGLSHLLGFDLMSRMKRLDEVTLYSFINPNIYSKRKYPVKPKREINYQLILEEWDNLLHLATSIKLEYCSASMILKRLNSYSKKNRLYRALREWGRIVKTNMVLRYIDDEGLRQRVQKMLNVVEHSNRFSRQIRFANKGELQHIKKEDLDVAEGCKRLIQNSIVYYNYCILEYLHNNSSSYNKASILSTIQRSSPMFWEHINFFGEYDFEKTVDPMLFISDQNEKAR